MSLSESNEQKGDYGLIDPFFSCYVYIRDLEKDLDTPLNLKVETITHLELLFWLIYFPNITGAKINTLVSHPLIFIY